jgi:Zn-dependent protease
LSSLSHDVIRECPNCNSALPLGAVACPDCHTLVYAAELDKLSREARALEAKGDLAQAREVWNRTLALLPPDSKQTVWVNDKLRALSTRINTAPDPQAKPDHAWAKKLGPLGPIAIVLAKSKGLLLAVFKLKFLFSFLAYLALYVAMFGWRFGVGFAVSILIHELGHFVDIKRRGLPAEMPVFLPGLGAYVKWNALGVTRRQVAQISLAGPLAGWLAAAACYVIYTYTHDPLWASLARTGAVINVLNLTPIWILDGGKAANPLGSVGRAALLAVALGCWLYFGENIFALVAAGIVWRLFTKDKPAQDDWSVWLYYAAVLIALGVVLHAVPAELVQRPIR